MKIVLFFHFLISQLQDLDPFYGFQYSFSSQYLRVNINLNECLSGDVWQATEVEITFSMPFDDFKQMCHSLDGKCPTIGVSFAF